VPNIPWPALLLSRDAVFKGHMVVSMRPYPLSVLPRIQAITRPFLLSHGEPVAFGPAGALALGITDLDGTKPDFGDPSEIKEGEVAVYWGCGVTPQLSVMDSAIEGIVVGHRPGMMLLCDIEDEEMCRK